MKPTNEQVQEAFRQAWLLAPESTRVIEAHLLSLSSVPEDVARDVSILSKSVAWSDGCCSRPPCVDEAEPALSRLATAAARVPGLEAELTGLRAAFDQEQGIAQRALAARDTAESERAAYKRDLQAEMDGADALRSELGAHEKETFPAFVRRLASERDAARQEAETLRTAYGNALTKGTAAEQEAGRLRMACSNLETENARLTARVAELERELAETEEELRAVAAERDAAQEQHLHYEGLSREAEARATAAEAKVKTLVERTESALRYAKVHQGQVEILLEQLKPAEEAAGNALAYLRALSRGGPRMDGDGELALVSDLEDVLKGRPTPAPGLREPSPRDVLAMMQPMRPDLEDMDGPYVTGYAEGVRDERARRGASVAPGLREAVGEVLRLWAHQDAGGSVVPLATWRGAHEALRAAYDSAPGGETHDLNAQGMCRPSCEACGATPEPVVTHAQLRAAAEECAEEPWLAEGARELVRRVTGGQAPATTDDESAPRARIDPTPEVPALGGWITESLHAQREAFDAKVAAGGARCQYGNEGGPCMTEPEANGWCSMHQHIGALWAKREAEPEPAAPEVVWEGGDIQVLENGYWLLRGQGMKVTDVCDVLARALAEAKRMADSAEARVGELLDAEKRKSAESMRERIAQKLKALLVQEWIVRVVSGVDVEEE